MDKDEEALIREYKDELEGGCKYVISLVCFYDIDAAEAADEQGIAANLSQQAWKDFVKDYIDIDVDLKTLAEDMTRVGNEYDSAEKLINATKLVVGEVLEYTNENTGLDDFIDLRNNIVKEISPINLPKIKGFEGR